jgi:hypothetical protein
MTIIHTRFTPTPIRRRLTITPLAVVSVLLLLVPSVASAARAHGFGSTFGGAGSGSGGLSLVSAVGGVAGSGVGVDGVSGDVFVADGGNHRVDEFTAAGVFVRMFGGEVDKTTKGDVCTAASGDVCGVGVSGSAPGEFVDPAFVAVDEGSGGEGSVYVGDVGDSTVSKFDAEGSLITSWGDGGLGESPDGQLTGTKELGLFGDPAGVAVDGAGNLWVYVGGTVEAPNDNMYEFDRAGVFQRDSPEDGHRGGYSPRGIGLDAVDDRYVSENGSVLEEESAAGAWLGTVAHPEGLIAGVAVDASQRGVYVDEERSGMVAYYSRECEASTISEKGCPPTETFGLGHIGAGAGIAINPVNGTVYVADSQSDEVDVFPVTVEANILPPSSVTSTSTVLRGEVDPEGAELAGCRFEYGEATSGETKTYTGSVPCEESNSTIGAGHSPVEVHAALTGLEGGSYHYRLAAHNANGVVHSEDEPFQALPLASIDGLESQEVSATSARLAAKVNPNGLTSTVYHFEYDTTPYTVGGSSHGRSIPVPDEPIVTGTGDVEVSQAITGLTANTTYYFRVVVSDVDGVRTSRQGTFIDLTATGGGEPCPNEALRRESNTDPKTGVPYSAGLPDCRAYEMVSPVEKNGALLGEVGLKGLAPQIADDGEQVITAAIQCFASATSCTGVRQEGGQPFEFTRTPEGWDASALTLPADLTSGETAEATNPNRGAALFGAVSKVTGLEEWFAREPDGTVKSVGPLGPNPGSSSIISGSPLIETTADLSYVIWGVKREPGWKFGGREEGEVFEYSGSGSRSPTLVAVSGGAGSNDLISRCGESLGGDGVGKRNLYGSLSADGSVVYFTVERCAGGTGANENVEVAARELYARVDGSQTVLISGHPAEGCSEPGCVGSAARDASFQGASRDGSKAFFTSTQRLTDSAAQDPRSQDTARGAEGCIELVAGASGCNLYESECAGACTDPAVRHLVDVSAGDSSGLGPRVQGVMAISPDGSHVYFVAQGVLTKGPNNAGREPVAGADNLYVYERDGAYPAGRLVFVSSLPGGTETSESQQWAEVSEADVTDDGGVLVFQSYGALTPDALPGAGSQVYRYDATSATLQRVSIGAGGGFDDDGNAGGAAAGIVPDAIFSRIGPGSVDPTMSADGSRVFFMSPKGLTPGALNEVASHGVGGSLVNNVFEWEADGTGSCQEVQGCVYLISDGTDVSEGTGLLGTDATGDNVFFVTSDRLVGQDTDTELDYYDARVDGGYPTPTRAVSCGSSGECHPGTGEPSVPGTPGSQSFTGPGNPTPVSSAKPVVGKPKTVAQVRAEKLKRALEVCKRDRSRKRRAGCERVARKRYGPRVELKSKPRLARRARAHERVGG